MKAIVQSGRTHHRATAFSTERFGDGCEAEAETGFTPLSWRDATARPASYPAMNPNNGKPDGYGLSQYRKTFRATAQTAKRISFP